MIRRLMTASLAALALAAPALAAPVAITNAKIWTGTDAGTIENGTLAFDGGRIIAIGTGIALPDGARVIDAKGRWVTPGIISAYSATGIVEVPAEDSSNDTSAGRAPYNVALRAADGFNPAGAAIDVTRIEGVTRIVVSPAAGNSIFGGQGFVADTSGRPDSVTRRDAFVFVELGETGAAKAGGSRPAAWTYFEAALSDARTFPAKYVAHNEGDALSRVDAQALGPAARGQQLILVHVERASDILNLLRLSREKPELRLAIVGASEGWMVARELAAARIPVIVNPISNLPGSFESLGATMENARRLIEAGVVVAFQHDGDEGLQARLVLQAAGNAVAHGVSHDAALQAITAAPAAIFGLPGLGQLQEGAMADVVLWDGDPLEVSSAPDAVFIDGAETPLDSRQTRLRDRYRTLDATTLPYAYRRP